MVQSSAAINGGARVVIWGWMKFQTTGVAMLEKCQKNGGEDLFFLTTLQAE
jgi:hypothetical protein